jgi:DNA-binding MarR family transcriptional regulator
MLEQSNNYVNEGGSQEDKIPSALSDNAGFLLNQTARLIRERIIAALAPLKLTPRELGLLRILGSGKALSQQALGARHRIDRTTIVDLIDDLQARDLVSRLENPQDRRSYLIHLTPKGKRTLTKAVRVAQKVQEEFLTPLAAGEWETLQALLTKLIEYHL